MNSEVQLAHKNVGEIVFTDLFLILLFEGRLPTLRFIFLR